jgi:hypothetical protein
MTTEPKSWTSGEVTVLLPDGSKLRKPGSIFGEVAVTELDGDWLALHLRSGLILGRFASETMAATLGHRLDSTVRQGLKRLPEAWEDGFWARLEELRAEVASTHGLPPLPPLRHQH